MRINKDSNVNVHEFNLKDLNEIMFSSGLLFNSKNGDEDQTVRITDYNVTSTNIAPHFVKFLIQYLNSEGDTYISSSNYKLNHKSFDELLLELSAIIQVRKDNQDPKEALNALREKLTGSSQ